MNAYGDDRKTILASTPGFEGASRIWAEWLLSDMRKWFTPCPHCDDFHVLDFATFGLSEGRPSFSCPSCGGVIEQSHRRAMNARGVWLPLFEHAEPAESDTSADADAKRAARARNPAPPAIIKPADIDGWRNRDCEGRPRGYHLWQAQSNLSSWAVIWDAWSALQNGTATPGADIEFSQKILGQPFARKVDRPDHEKLWEARGVMYPSVKIGVPEWAGLVTGAIDVQHNRLEWAVYAWGRGGVGARIGFGVIPKSPLTWSTWSEDADRLVRSKFTGPNFAPRGADYWLVDSGGNATNEVYAFCMARHRSEAPVLPIKGDGRADAPAFRKGSMVNVWRDKRVIGKVQLWLVGVHQLKSRIYEGLHLGALSAETKKLEGRSLHFPQEMSKEEFGQLTAETLKRPKGGGAGKWEKVSAGGANEQLDMAVYCLAGAINAMMDSLSNDAWPALLSARAPDKVKADLTPIELAALPDDDPVKIAAQAPKAEAPKAEGRAPPKPTEADIREVAKLFR
jgi:phage terminase large subunit GpA-like protein